MTLWIKVILITMVIIVSFFGYKKVRGDYIKQKEIVMEIKTKIRKRKSEFDIAAYIDCENYQKDRNWFYQRNRGKHPCDLKKKIKVRDFSDGCQYIIMKKGL